MERTFDLNVAAMTPLITPRALKAKLPMTEAANRTVVEGRRAIRNILDGADRRLLVIVGPCSIHDRDGALEYAERLAVLAEEVKNEVLVVMRTYFEKPRTTIGWKGLFFVSKLDTAYEMKTGLYRAREILLRVNEM
ncbi:MAG TPA: 3-deoxy-7-phosphoheptulonate synthase, partial [Candidatus Hydrogenedentes bacterium]|nr:3-deoxy-7-phosphoheptulonate synthase [Candidatus Hydrogenedentota bacterium]